MTKNNKDRVQHLAFIPARKGSLVLNLKIGFFRNTQISKNNKMFDRTIVSTNDDKIKKIAQNFDFEIHNRNNDLSGHKYLLKIP